MSGRTVSWIALVRCGEQWYHHLKGAYHKGRTGKNSLLLSCMCAPMEKPHQQAPNFKGKDRAERRKLARSRFGFSRSSPIFKLLTILGPGLIAANAGNDAGGIATFASAGANYGYNLLWALAVAGFCLAIVQEMCARMGAVTGKGLADLIREQFGVRWAALAMLALLVANTGVTVSEFLGIAASVQVLANDIHTPFVYLVVPLSGLILWWLVIKGSYRRVEKVFLFISLGFLAYIPAAFAAHPSWSTMYEQLDVYSSTVFAVFIAGFVIIASAAALYRGHPLPVAIDAIAAAQALRSFAGQYASLLFGVGMFGASLLAGAVLPLSTSYGICEAFGFERGVSRSFKEAPVFQSIFTGLIILGVLIAIIPGLPIFQVLVLLQDLNAAMLPILLVFIILLVNNRRLMGRRVNNLAFNIISWATVVLVTILIILFLLNQLFGITL